MTVIAAVATEQGVVMGADVAGNLSGSFVMKSHGTPKIHTITAGPLNNEPVLIGVAGNGGIGPTIARGLTISDVPKLNRTDAEVDRWAYAVAAAITELLADTNPPLTMHNSEGAPGIDGAILMAWRQHLWYVTTHQALRPADNVAAIGSGSDVALGSIHTGLAAGHDADHAVAEAIRWACLIDTGCRIDLRGPLMKATTR